MRMIVCAALAALAMAATPAIAQDDPYAGTWAFQTSTYGDDQFGVIMSGAAIITPAAPGRYDIRLVANELIHAHETGQSQMLTAHQTCTGETDGAQFSISCQLAEPLDGYEPDNFAVQPGRTGELIGVLSSAASAQVTFTRVR
ncbi:MAG: hypothetical protein AB7O98_06235 [Hyphomonadaceae bacterium]